MNAKPINYDEALVPDYTLPDPLTFAGGAPVTGAADWAARRSEILDLFRHHVYGHAPDALPAVTCEMVEQGTLALGPEGRDVTRKQVACHVRGPHGDVDLNLLLYLPTQAGGPVPAFLGLNFNGNHTVQPDPAILLPTAWVRENEALGTQGHIATAAGRGKAAGRWPLEMIAGRGYAVATMYCGDSDPDFDDGFTNGVHALFPRDDSRGDGWATLAAWAWGLSRALDYLIADPDIDGQRVAVIGHSRLGKAAVWAGARDARFAAVISNDSGCGGAALSRRRFGETVARINTIFPHWFCTNFKAYNDHEEALPVDQHMLLTLVAPRPLYVASASEDQWADPRGEFLAAHHASPVYRLLGVEGLGAEEMPAPGEGVSGLVSYHLRPGKHDLTAYDWARYLDFADRYLTGA